MLHFPLRERWSCCCYSGLFQPRSYVVFFTLRCSQSLSIKAWDRVIFKCVIHDNFLSQGGSIYQRAPDFAKSIHKAEVIKIGKLEYRQPTGVPKPGLVKSFWEDLLKTCKSFCTDNSLSQDVPFQFGLHIHATPGVMITSANKKPVKKSGMYQH